MRTIAHKRPIFSDIIGIVVASAMAILLMGQQSASAHDYPDDLKFLWDTNVSFVIESRTTYPLEVAAGGDDWDDSTDVSTSVCTPDGSCGVVIHYDSYYGSDAPVAWASPYTNGNGCVTNYEFNGTCDETTAKADFAYIYWNTYYPWDSDLAAIVSTHEVGHVFGLAHTACAVDSTMRDGNLGCGSYLDYVASHDVTDANAKY
jgi:hypothetical protein